MPVSAHQRVKTNAVIPQRSGAGPTARAGRGAYWIEPARPVPCNRLIHPTRADGSRIDLDHRTLKSARQQHWHIAPRAPVRRLAAALPRHNARDDRTGQEHRHCQPERNEIRKKESSSVPLAITGQEISRPANISYFYSSAAFIHKFAAQIADMSVNAAVIRR